MTTIYRVATTPATYDTLATSARDALERARVAQGDPAGAWAVRQIQQSYEVQVGGEIVLRTDDAERAARSYHHHDRCGMPCMLTTTGGDVLCAAGGHRGDASRVAREAWAAIVDSRGLVGV